jgi:hypothetical protein
MTRLVIEDSVCLVSFKVTGTRVLLESFAETDSNFIGTGASANFSETNLVVSENVAYINEVEQTCNGYWLFI